MANKKNDQSTPKQEAQKDIVTIVILGLGGVGKSSLITRYCYDEFNEEYDPSQNSQHEKIIENKNVKLLIYDTPGEEDITTQELVYKRSQGAIVVAEVIEPIDERSVYKFVDAFRRNKDVEKIENIPIILCLSKVDIDENVTKWQIHDKDIENFKEKFNIQTIFKTSSKDENFRNVIKEMIETLVDLIFKHSQSDSPAVAADSEIKPARKNRKKFLCFK